MYIARSSDVKGPEDFSTLRAWHETDIILCSYSSIPSKSFWRSYEEGNRINIDLLDCRQGWTAGVYTTCKSIVRFQYTTCIIIVYGQVPIHHRKQYLAFHIYDHTGN